MKPEFYLTRPEEYTKCRELRMAKGKNDNGTGWLELIEALAGGDPVVFSAMWSFANFAHALDDIIDDTELDAEQTEIVISGLHEAVNFALTREGNGYDVELLILRLISQTNWDEFQSDLAYKAWLQFSAALHDNQFIRRHRHELRGQFAQALTKWLDGDEMARSGDLEKESLAPAVRCADLDVLFHMVYLARGWAALRACGRLREYDLPDTRKEVV